MLSIPKIKNSILKKSKDQRIHNLKRAKSVRNLIIYHQMQWKAFVRSGC